MWKSLGIVGGLCIATTALGQEHTESENHLSAAGPGIETTPIINGEDASIDDYPEAGGLIAKGKLGPLEGTVFLCSSTLIAPDVVLTAAHCVDVENMIGVELDELSYHYIRDYDLTRFQFGSTTGDIPQDAGNSAEHLPHPDFVGSQGVQIGLAKNHDIALVFLEEAVDYPYAYLPTKEEVSQEVEGLDVVIVGWGQQEQDAGAGQVQLKQMADSYISIMGETEFQVGANKEDGRKCHGDSGGPSFAWVETEALEDMRVIGVTSHAFDTTDCNNTGGVDTRVSAYLDWIDAEMRSRCENGTRVWCDEPGIIPPPMPVQEDTGDGEEEPVGGCACSAGTLHGTSLGLLLALPLIVRVRRRK